MPERESMIKVEDVLPSNYSEIGEIISPYLLII
jgi:hypothetical protein